MKDINQLEEALANRDQRIAELLAEKKAFIRIVSHDLRSPISRIIGFADLLEKDLEKDEDLQEFAKLIVGAGWQLSDMIARIMEVEEFESESRELVPVPIDLSNSISSIIEDHRPLFEKKQISLEIDLSASGQLYTSDKVYFDLVITNLLTNAAKFSPKGSKVTVKLQHESFPIFTVADEGLGFQDQEKELAFEKFSKLSTRPTDGETATGLGLYVVKKCLEKMGDSEIAIHDNTPEGAIMEVRFR